MATDLTTIEDGTEVETCDLCGRAEALDDLEDGLCPACHAAEAAADDAGEVEQLAEYELAQLHDELSDLKARIAEQKAACRAARADARRAEIARDRRAR